MSLKAMFAGASKGASRLSESFDDLMFIGLKVIVVSVALAAVHKYAGMRALGDMQSWYIYFGLGAAAVGLEYYGSQVLVDGWYNRSIGGVAFGAALTLTAIVLSYSNVMSSAAVQQSQAAGTQKANFRKTVNTEQAVKEAEFSLTAAMDARSKLKPTRSAAEARASIDSAQAHKWWNYTESCAKPKGKESRGWCDAYRSAVADLALWDDISREDARIGNLKAKADEARAMEAETPTTVSEVRADVLEYAAWLGTDAQGGQLMQARHTGITITLFVSLLGLLTAWKRNQGRELKPWGFITWLRRKWHMAWNGSDAGFDAGERTVVNNISMTDDRAIERLRAMGKELKAATAPAVGVAA